MSTTQVDLPLIIRPEKDPSWRLKALCRGSSVNNFFKEKGAGTSDSYAKERIVCVVCPVREQCLDYALEYSIPYGFYGGLSHLQRRSVKMGRAQKGIPMTQVIKDLRRLKKKNPIREAAALFNISETEVRKKLTSEKDFRKNRK